MRIKQQLLYGFLSISIMTLAISYITGMAVQQDIIESFHKVAGEKLPGNVAMARMSTEMYFVRDLAEKYVTHGRTSDKQKIENSLANLNTYMAMHFTYHIEEDSDDDSLEGYIYRFTSFITEYILQSQKNSGPEVLRRTRQKIDKVIRGFTAAADEHIELENRQSSQKLKDAREATRKARRVMIISAIMIIGIALGVSHFISGIISRPIILLSKAAAEVGKGRLDVALDVTSGNEIGQLAQAFKDMAMNLSAIHEELTVTNENLMEEIYQREIIQASLDKEKTNLESVLDSLPGVFYQIDVTDKLVNWNKTVEDVTGYCADEISRMQVLDFFVNEDQARIVDAFVEVRSKGYAETEVTVITKNRKKIPFFVTGNLKIIDDQEFVVGMAMDITEMKRAEAQINKALGEKEILLREIHHRVKNNMTIINALLSLQSRNVVEKNISEVFVEIQNRIRAMAMVHEMLYQSEDFSQSNVRDYIHRLTSHLTRSLTVKTKPIKFVFEVEDINFGLDTMIPFGLILNELMTNSIKHAFRENERPAMTITLSRHEESVRFIYCDNGPGMSEEVDLSQTDTLGLRIINVLSAQIDGVGSFVDSDDGGVKFSLAFPVNQALSPITGGRDIDAQYSSANDPDNQDTSA